MKYRVRLTLQADVEVSVEIEAESQHEAIVAGYDHAIAATTQSVRVTSVNTSSAFLDSCEAVGTPEPVETAVPPSPYQRSEYRVNRFFSPQSHDLGRPDATHTFEEYPAAVEFCQGLESSKDDYSRRVSDLVSNKLFEVLNPVGGFVVVAFADAASYAARQYTPWAGWIGTAKEAKKQALLLLDARKVFAVGVLDARVLGAPPLTVMNLSRAPL